MISVAVIDDHYVVRVGIKAIIDMDSELSFAGEYGKGMGAAAFVFNARPDVVLLDIRMPDRDGIAVLDDIMTVRPNARVVMLTTSDTEEEIFRALKAGAKGYLLKDRDSDSICRAVKVVARGGTFVPDAVREIYRRRQMMDELTARERQVLSHVVDGRTNEEIASLLGIAYESAKVHVKHIFAKFGAQSRADLVSQAYRRGFAK